MTLLALTCTLGAVVGWVLGLTGAGGAILAVPLLMWGLGWTLPQAAPVALVAVSVSAAVGTIAGWDVKLVRYRAAMLIAGIGTLLSPLGLKAAAVLPTHTLSMLFAAVLVVAAIRMALGTRRSPAEAFERLPGGDLREAPAAGPVCKLSENTGRILWTRPCALALAASGALTGFLSGLLGVGGGFVLVPVLRAVTNLSIHSAVATALMAVALTGAGAVGVALWQGVDLPWRVALPFVGGALLGMVAGRRLAPKLPAPKLQQGFAVLMVVVAAALALQALV